MFFSAAGMARLLFLFLGFSCLSDAKPFRVLVLQSYHQADWSDSILAGVRSVLDTIPNVEISVEYMDTKRLESPAYFSLLDSLFSLKYAPSKFDAVLVSDDPAYRYFLSHGVRIWGDLPMSFCGVNEYQDSAWQKHPRVTGIVETGDFRANLKFALQARPRAQRIWIICDSSQASLVHKNRLMTVLSDFPQLRPVFLSGIRLDSLTNALQKAPSTDFGLFISFWKEPGDKEVHSDALRAIFSSASIPIFGWSEWMIGNGITGGLCTNGFLQGRTAARLLLNQIHNSPARVPVLTESPSAFLFDHRLLSRHQISDRLLPPGSRIFFQPSSVLEIPHSTIVVLGIALALGAILVLLLFLNYHRRLQLSRHLTKKESEFRMLVETQTDLVVKVDLEGYYQFVSPSYCKFFHTTEQHLLGSKFHPRIHPDDLSGTLKAMEALCAPPYKAYMEQRVLVPEGERWLGWNDTAVLDQHGKVIAIIGAGRDITERKRMELERERLIDELRRKNFELERYAYTVSHDLRSPLVTIMGFANELAMDVRDGDTSNATDYLQRIINAGARMNALLEAILHLSRIGRITTEPSPIPLKETLDEVLAQLAEPLRKSRVELRREPDSEWPTVLGDRQRIAEVFQNLLENSLKYMGPQESPQIILSASRTHSSVLVCIEDNGIGIEHGQLEKIFGLFSKLDPKSSGIGFGLALCKHIMENMNGAIWAESNGPGAGSRFFCKFPYSPLG